MRQLTAHHSALNAKKPSTILRWRSNIPNSIIFGSGKDGWVAVLAVSGPGMGLEKALAEGDSCTVGRTNGADVPIPQDTFLSGLHFSIGYNDGIAVLQDLGSSNGTKLNGFSVTQTRLQQGDVISAGSTTFLIRFRDAEYKAASPFEILTGQHEPVYAVLDSARDPAICPLILSCGLPYCSLYRGDAEADLEMVAPYLVSLAPDLRAMADIVARGWSNAWGIFLTCGQSMEEVRKQLRRSLMISIEGSREQLYFRFYDPRVLRLFLPIADPVQFEEFAGPITNFFTEAEEPGVMIKFHRHGPSVWADRIGVKPAEPRQRP